METLQPHPSDRAPSITIETDSDTDCDTDYDTDSKSHHEGSENKAQDLVVYVEETCNTTLDDDPSLDTNKAVTKPTTCVTTTVNVDIDTTKPAQCDAIDTEHNIEFKCNQFVRNTQVIGRILLLVLNLLLLTLSTLYCIGQSYGSTLDLVRPCEGKELSEIWKHSYESGLMDGDNGELKINFASQYGQTSESCWTTQPLDINTDSLWYSNVYAAHKVAEPVTFESVAFGLLALYCFYLICYNIYTLISDCIYASKNQLHKTSKLFTVFMDHQNAPQPAQAPVPRTESGFHAFSLRIVTVWNKYMRGDTTGWIIRGVISEIVEITIQSQALLLYNGYNLLDPNNKRDIYIANHPRFIILFAAVIAFNCFGSGIVWLSYALMTKYCHGFVFKMVLFFVDQFSDLLYTMFPFIVILFDDYNHDKENIAVLLAQLNTNSTEIAFVSAFVPLFILGVKSIFIIRAARMELADKYYAHWKFIYDISKEKDDQQAVYKAKLTGWKLTNAALQHNNKEIFGANANATLPVNRVSQTNINWIQRKMNDSDTVSTSHTKQCVLLTIASVYIIYGIGVLASVVNHFNHSQRYCAMIQETNYFENGQSNIDVNSTVLSNEQYEILQNNPELFFWNKCLYKVYPFLNNDKNSAYHHQCQCRVLVIDWNETISTAHDRNSYFNVTQPLILTNMLTHWYQLEKFRTNNVEQTTSQTSDPKIKFTKQMFIATRMKAFEWNFAKIKCIEQGISGWQQLEYLKFEETKVQYGIPNDFAALKKMKYLSLVLNGLQSFPDSICNLTKLQVLDIQMEISIASIPQCISKLVELQQLNVENCVYLQNVPLSTFNLPKLVILSLSYAMISLNSIIHYNAPSDIDSNDTNASLEWLRNAFIIGPKIKEFYFALNPICDSLANVSWYQSKLKERNLTMEQVCSHPCKLDIKDPQFRFCSPRLFGDGRCDAQCEFGDCFADGGDCIQLCFSTDCTYDLWENDVCDDECNNRYCMKYSDDTFQRPETKKGSGNGRVSADMYHCVHNYSKFDTDDLITATHDNVTCADSISTNTYTYFDIPLSKLSTANMPLYPRYFKCQSKFLGNGVCDDLCRTDQCDDGGDCGSHSCTDNACSYIYTAWLELMGPDVYIMSISYLCDIVYPKIEMLFGTVPFIHDELSCYNSTSFWDWNDDRFMNFREFTYVSARLAGGTPVVVIQYNCSQCVGMEYYNIKHEYINNATSQSMDTCDSDNS